jgi:mitogen-activated protein kinase kinase
MEKHNRISHLAPQLSPATQNLLRDGGVSPPVGISGNTATPTSGEILIVGEVKAYSTSSGSRKNPPNGLAGGLAHPPRTSSTSTQLTRELRDLSLRGSESTPPAPPPAGPLPPPPGLNGRAIAPKKPSVDVEAKKDVRRQGTTSNYTTYEAPPY